MRRILHRIVWLYHYYRLQIRIWWVNRGPRHTYTSEEIKELFKPKDHD